MTPTVNATPPTAAPMAMAVADEDCVPCWSEVVERLRVVVLDVKVELSGAVAGVVVVDVVVVGVVLVMAALL